MRPCIDHLLSIGYKVPLTKTRTEDQRVAYLSWIFLHIFLGKWAMFWLFSIFSKALSVRSKNTLTPFPYMYPDFLTIYGSTIACGGKMVHILYIRVILKEKDTLF